MRSSEDCSFSNCFLKPAWARPQPRGYMGLGAWPRPMGPLPMDPFWAQLGPMHFVFFQTGSRAMGPFWQQIATIYLHGHGPRARPTGPAMIQWVSAHGQAHGPVRGLIYGLIVIQCVSAHEPDSGAPDCMMEDLGAGCGSLEDGIIGKTHAGGQLCCSG